PIPIVINISSHGAAQTAPGNARQKLCVLSRQVTSLNQELFDCRGRNRRKTNHLAPRTNSRQKRHRIGGRENEVTGCRWLFKRFQKGVGRLLVHEIGILDNEYAGSAFEGAKVGLSF